MQGQECSEWVPDGESPGRWLSCPGGVAAANRQNSSNQVSHSFCTTCWLEADIDRSKLLSASTCLCSWLCLPQSRREVQVVCQKQQRREAKHPVSADQHVCGAVVVMG